VGGLLLVVNETERCFRCRPTALQELLCYMLMLFLVVLYVDKEAAQLQPHVFGIYTVYYCWLYFSLCIFFGLLLGWMEIRVELVTI
jgi:prolipoprotein diacylglyceryltransferase